MSRLLALATTVLVALLCLAPAADAACPSQTGRQVFAPWGDYAMYTLAAGGSLEGKAADSWALSGARVVKENEPYFLNAPREKASLAIGAGGVATSPATCVALEHPTVRFMVRSTGSPLGVLAVDAVVRNGSGVLDLVPMGVVSGLSGSAWQPSLPMVLTNGLVGSLVDGSAFVRFRFTTLGLGGAFQIDDVFVDPYKRG